MNSGVSKLVVFDDGSGPALHVAGRFSAPSGGLFGLAKWDGTNWSPFGTLGINDTTWGVRAVEVFDDGAGQALYVGGDFTSINGISAACIAKSNGSTWSALGAGTPDDVLALAVYDDGSGPALYASGQFTSSSSGDAYLAKWGCTPPSPSGSPYCTSPLTSNSCVPTMSASGSASASAGSGFTLSATAVEGSKAGLLFYGMSGAAFAPWAPGSTSALCVKPPVQRMGAQTSGGTSGSCDGVLAQDWNAYVTSHPGALGQTFSGGESVWAQAWFRDPPAPKTTNLSSAIVFSVGP
jgi:hypothetical protein